MSNKAHLFSQPAACQDPTAKLEHKLSKAFWGLANLRKGICMQYLILVIMYLYLVV